jgi:hypothetical protein
VFSSEVETGSREENASNIKLYKNKIAGHAARRFLFTREWKI